MTELYAGRQRDGHPDPLTALLPGVGSRVVLLKVHPYYAQKSTVLMKKVHFFVIFSIN